MKITLKEVAQLKNLMENTYKTAIEMKKIEDYSVSSNEEYLENMLDTYSKQLESANEVINGVASIFVVPIPMLLEELNKCFAASFPQYKIEYDVSGDEYSRDKFFYTTYITKNGIEIGSLFTKGYYYQDFSGLKGFDEIDGIVKTKNDDLNTIDISAFLRSSKMLKTNFAPDILEIINTPSTQIAFWNVVKENVKAKIDKEIYYKQTEIEIAQHQANESNKKLEKLQEEKTKLEKDIKDDDFNL